MILTLIIFTLLNIGLAYIDSKQFAKGKTVSHILNGLEIIAILLIPYFLFHNWWLIAALLFNRLLIFNISLSLFQGKKWNYITPEIKPASIIDRLAKMVFGMRGTLMYLIYFIIFILLLIKTFI
jgi:hypothetical protein